MSLADSDCTVTLVSAARPVVAGTRARVGLGLGAWRLKLKWVTLKWRPRLERAETSVHVPPQPPASAALHHRPRTHACASHYTLHNLWDHGATRSACTAVRAIFPVAAARSESLARRIVSLTCAAFRFLALTVAFGFLAPSRWRGASFRGGLALFNPSIANDGAH